MQGKFIVLEGPDGSGTTTHSKRLEGFLVSKGFDVVLTREPTEGPIGKFIRAELKAGTLSPSALQLLFCADRAWHIGNELLPALEAGKIVISDRYLLSTIAYGTALGLDAEWLTQVNSTFIKPDCQILLLPPLKVSMERVGSRADREILEEDSLQVKVHQAYTDASKDPSLCVVDSSGEKDEVAERIFGHIKGCLSL